MLRPLHLASTAPTNPNHTHTHTNTTHRMAPPPPAPPPAAASLADDDEAPPPLSFALPPASQLDYLLPEERIAIRPAEPRDASLLLVSDTSQGHEQPWVCDAVFRELPSFLPAQALLVLNQSRVITARLLMHKEGTGGKAEVLCISPVEPSWDPAVALAAPSGQSVWRCMIGGKNIKAGTRLVLTTTDEEQKEVTLVADVVAREGKDGLVRFSWTSPDPAVAQQSFGHVLERVGKIPLPPYMNRASDAADIQDYQTVYAQAKGSVAAPTAGLHFTQDLLQQLQAGPKAIEPCYVTLHVGAGTFQPVSGDDVGAHAMHWERVSVPLSTLEQLIEASAHGRPILSVGTTSVRTLESLYWWGASLLSTGSSSSSRIKSKSVADLSLGQWDPYRQGVLAGSPRTAPLVPATTALQTLHARAQEEGLDSVGGETQLMVAPGYRFALCDGLVTNFHQPRSTLLLLVSALMGGLGPVHRIYRHALRQGSGFRFLSFGDSNLMIPPARSLLPVRPGRGDGGGGGGSVAWPRKGGEQGGKWTHLID